VSEASKENKQDEEAEMLQGALAARMGYVTWAAGAGDLNREMERILNMLREKSAVALRLTKAGARLGQAEQAKQATPLEALQLINKLYLSEVMQSQDASEGLHAFLEKRKPAWKNR
jgi:1,4-dihydroxy-2-naphthoyl-CoA synthase